MSKCDNVLNPQLYTVLASLFGAVSVSNQGEQVRLTEAVADTPVLRRRGLKVTSAMVKGGERYGVNCPFCKDRFQRLNISYAWGMRADYDGLTVEFPRSLAICYNENCLSVDENYRALSRMLETGTGGAPLAVMSDESLPPQAQIEVELPAGAPVNDANLPPYISQYLESRGFDPTELAVDYQVKVALIPFYDNPVLIFPVYQQQHLAFWQARYIGPCAELDKDGKARPKYYTSKGTKKSWTLYNLDRAQSETTVVLVEGVFDAIRVGRAGVAMFGSRPSLAQERMLHVLWKRGKLVWLPDQDDPKAWDTAMGYADNWNARNLFEGGAHVIRLPAGKDPADCNREELWRLICTK